MALVFDLIFKNVAETPDVSRFDKEVLDLSYPGRGFSNAESQQALILDAINDIKPPLLPRPPKNSSQMIEEAMQSLSLVERQRVEQDLLGVKPLTSSLGSDSTSKLPDTTSKKFQQKSLEKMEDELQRLRAGSSWSLQMAAIELAEQQDPAFVKNTKFRLQFLETEDWDATQAASRFIRYFDWKLELFGEEKLTKPITLKDLQPPDLDMLRAGYTQLLPCRDKAGRSVFFAFNNGQVYDSPQSLARQLFYLASTRDKECDNCGAVFVLFKISGFRFANTRGAHAFMAVQRTTADMPLRWCALHKFMETGTPGYPRMERLVDASINLFKPPIRARMRIHQGSYTEWAYKIMSFGIPYHLIPLTTDYKLKTKNHLEWLCMRQTMEEFAASPGSSMIETTDLPCNKDVLLGKGKPIQEFCGNQRLATLVDNYMEEYNNCSRIEKTTLAAKLVSTVKEYGGHFLSKESGVWISVSDDLARDKVSHMFRHQRHRVHKSAQQLTGNCSTVRDYAEVEGSVNKPNLNKKART